VINPLNILAGDCRETLKRLPPKSVHCCVTSPPYWGLRDYGVDGQIGLEKTIDAYIEKIVAVFHEVWRVLRNDGTCWINLGDTYAGGGMGGGGSFACDGPRMISEPGADKNKPGRGGGRLIGGGIKSKDMVGLPWRVAFALQAAGWYLRSDIIWHKRNPMPESINDRPTKSHEYVFLLSKQPRYYYDAEAIKEPVSGTAHARGNGINAKIKLPGNKTHKGLTAYENGDARHRTKAGLVRYAAKVKQNASFSSAVCGLVSKRNKRSVWSLATAPYREAHFATYPPELIRPCILAGTSAHGACSMCGAPYSRQIERGAADPEWQKACGADANGEYNGTAQKDYVAARAQNASEVKARILAGMRERKTVGWKPTCDCALSSIDPCVVLDPFAGSGTTGMVALQEGRHAILCELNPSYVTLIEKRCAIATP
jgi:DNA modification methylase